MHTVIFIALLAALTTPFRVRPFEALAWTILTSPVWIFLALKALPPSIPLYWGIVLLNLLCWCLLRRNELKESALKSASERGALIALLGFSTLIFFFTQQWDEFFPMGERLRDYALLSSVIRSPLVLSEPWLHGYGLNYYAFWYRTGNLLSTILALPAPAIYNQLQALAFGFYLGATYRIANRFLGWSWAGSLFATLLIGFGSNTDGIFSVMQGDDGWWGPSRVIAGAINEFPVWSFLLGDLHPHFLNLGMIPLLLILFLHLTDSCRQSEKLGQFLLLGGSFMLVGALLIYNANAWEVPVWGLMIGGLIGAHLLSQLKTSPDVKVALRSLGTTLTSLPSVLLLLVTATLTTSLWLSSRNIVPNPFPATFVKAPIPQTTLFEFFRHWGIPMTGMLVALSASRTRYLLPGMIVVVSVATLLTGTATPVLWGAFFLLAVPFFQQLRDTENAISNQTIISRVVALTAMILCLVPEYIFLDDPYGGENERMNTIFKMYSSNWFFFHLGALCLVREQLGELKITRALRNACMVSMLILGCAFFAHTIKLRKTIQRPTVTQYGSLAKVADEFPGSAETILFLRSQPGTVVLEAQGDAYNWTSCISTLADKDAYLGWANHVNLLVREYGEISRREKITERFYTADSCEERRTILQEERIDFAVVGSLELKRHPQSRTRDYSCLKEVFSSQGYRVFALQAD